MLINGNCPSFVGLLSFFIVNFILFLENTLAEWSKLPLNVGLMFVFVIRNINNNPWNKEYSIVFTHTHTRVRIILNSFWIVWIVCIESFDKLNHISVVLLLTLCLACYCMSWTLNSHKMTILFIMCVNILFTQLIEIQ